MKYGSLDMTLVAPYLEDHPWDTTLVRLNDAGLALCKRHFPNHSLTCGRYQKGAARRELEALLWRAQVEEALFELDAESKATVVSLEEAAAIKMFRSLIVGDDEEFERRKRRFA
jgi:hypothetical protein